MQSDDKAVLEEIQACIEGYVADLLSRAWPQRGEPDDDGLVEMAHALEAQFGISFSIEEEPFRSADGTRHLESDALGHAILERLSAALEARREEGRELKEGPYADLEHYPTFEQIVRDLQLQILDQQWKAHLHTMDQLRGGINMRAYAQRDPKLEYQREGFALFGEMEQRIDDTMAEYALKFSFPRPNLGPQATARRVDAEGQKQAAAAQQARPASQQAAPASATPAAAVAGAGAMGGAVAKVGRNEPCPCGSGRKYKKCHGA
jgi:preprotein translocase subunit SecA